MKLFPQIQNMKMHGSIKASHQSVQKILFICIKQRNLKILYFVMTKLYHNVSIHQHQDLKVYQLQFKFC
ncbi:unnamed protein product [Paramecium primaurelia]|uniref:Uncharacterized protein n=1 Tax=Paramecium primaurelia TaxID=5886 RepID=A0A8S1L6J3_PARPR|nr:unnamed protein product [Paramecium primaurelia]